MTRGAGGGGCVLFSAKPSAGVPSAGRVTEPTWQFPKASNSQHLEDGSRARERERTQDLIPGCTRSPGKTEEEEEEKRH